MYKHVAVSPATGEFLFAKSGNCLKRGVRLTGGSWLFCHNYGVRFGLTPPIVNEEEWDGWEVCNEWEG